MGDAQSLIYKQNEAEALDNHFYQSVRYWI